MKTARESNLYAFVQEDIGAHFAFLTNNRVPAFDISAECFCALRYFDYLFRHDMNQQVDKKSVKIMSKEVVKNK